MERFDMKRKAAFAAALKALCFLLLLALLLNAVTELVLPKDYALTSLWPATSNAEGLYRLKRNTLDVLILGSSKAYTAFIPQELYDGWGIRAYDLGTDLQSGLISWYWLKEALRFQKPAAVVLEIHDFFPVYDYLPLNAPEAMIRYLFKCPCNTVIVPMQDVLNLGSEARMNYPGTIGGNWGWRMKPGMLTQELSLKYYKLNKEANRR